MSVQHSCCQCHMRKAGALQYAHKHCALLAHATGTPVSEPWLLGHVGDVSHMHDPGCAGAESKDAQSSACAGWDGVQGLLQPCSRH